MMKIILYIWQLPQNLIGKLLVKIFAISYDDGGFYRWNLAGSISLGKYVILSENAGSLTLRHEQGHQIQSKILGWLYIPVIGIPSFIWAGFQIVLIFFKNKPDYYWFYTEAWADKLAGINRKDDAGVQ